jgi:tetratricopeptide (TPR) repeat protein
VIDRDIHLARALLVEGSPLMRSLTAGQLRDAGVGHVSTASRPREARLLLEREDFDILVCNRDFGDDGASGQDLLDELRRENLLRHSTVFLMVSDQATYNQVVEAAESALDGLLVRPYTAAMLGQRLAEARKRKRELADVLRALDAGQPEQALFHALKRFQGGLPYAAYCGRLAAELLMGAQKFDEARLIFERLAHAGAKSWARLGVARAQMALGDVAGARDTVDAVLEAEPDTADAHDLSGRILVDQCDFEAALGEYRRAAELTPGCLLRAQHAGALAFYQGHRDEALQRLERAVALGAQSKLFDALSLLLVAVLRFDAGNPTGVTAMRDQLVHFRARFPDSVRLQRFEAAAQVLASLLGRDPSTALTGLRTLSAQAGDDNFDLEAANMILALWARVPEGLAPAEEQAGLVERVALRFCVSRSIGEVLVAAAQRKEAATGVIRRCQAQVSSLAEQAMDRALAGAPEAAARDLLAEGEKTLNAKLLEMAGRLARRHDVADAQALAERAAAVVQRSCRSVNHIAGIQRSGRSPGGLQLRGRSPQEAAHATA